MNRFIVALQFLTIFRVKKTMETRPGEFSGSMAYFPLVGAVQGGILVIADYLLARFLPLSIVDALLLLVLVVINGALHLDGFADTVDALAGGATPEERLGIMRDSSVGAVGVVFIVFVLLLKYLCLGAAPDGFRSGIIFLFPVAGRWSMVPMSYWSGYARKEGGLGKSFTGAGISELITATVLAAAMSVFIIGVPALFFLLFLGSVVFLLSAFFSSRLGGVTGDVFGFQSEVAEVLFLLLVPQLIRSF